MAKFILYIILIITTIMNAGHQSAKPSTEICPSCGNEMSAYDDSCQSCADSSSDSTLEIAVSSENFAVDEAMMTYFISETISPYSQYLSLLGVDTSESLKTQAFTDEQSWYDYFAECAMDYVGELLVLCEYAHEHGITLTAGEYSYIDSCVSSIIMEAKASGYTTDEYLVYKYGDGITQDVFVRCMEFEQLATIAQDAFEETKESTREDRLAFLQENEELFLTVDYIECTFTLSAFTKYDENGIAITSRDEDILAAKNAARELSKQTSAEDFIAYAESNIFTSGEPYTYDSYIEIINTSSIDYLSDKVSKWARHATAGSTTTEISTEYDPTFSVYMLLRSASVDEAPVRNIKHILLTYDSYEENEAYAIYKEWEASGFSAEKFTELAFDYSEDYNAEGLCSDISHADYFYGLDRWIFDSDRTVGDRDIIETSYGWHIVEYLGEGELQTWEVQALDYMSAGDYEEIIETGLEKIAFNMSVINGLNF